MAYTDFTWEELVERFDVRTHHNDFLPEVTSIKPSEVLAESLNRAKALPLRKEKAKSEGFIAPILFELAVRSNHYFTVYSGETLLGNRQAGLVGEIDFFIAKRTDTIEISFPIVSVVEAKWHDLDIGLPQCAAQLLGAQLLNSRRGYDMPLYGCVTTASEWQFMRLNGQEIDIEKRTYKLDNLPELLGVFNHILTFYRDYFEAQGMVVEEPMPAYGALW